MKTLLRTGLGVVALVALSSAGRAQWGAPPPGPGCDCGYGPPPVYGAAPVYGGAPGVYTPGPGVCCSAPCNDCCRRGLLGRIKDRICHSSPACCGTPCCAPPCCPTTCCAPPCCTAPCCPTTCCSPCGQCCNPCPCEPCRHPILDKLRALRCKCAPRECCSPCGDCCPPRHRLLGWLHRDKCCCPPPAPCCGSYPP
jgi:DNA helicase MCM8